MYFQSVLPTKALLHSVLLKTVLDKPAIEGLRPVVGQFVLMVVHQSEKWLNLLVIEGRA